MNKKELMFHITPSGLQTDAARILRYKNVISLRKMPAELKANHCRTLELRMRAARISIPKALVETIKRGD